MAFCPNCGTKLKEGARFCPECGKTTGGVSASPGPANTGQTQQGEDEPNKGMAVVAYLLFFIPLLTGDHKKSEFVKFHTNQGTVLFLFSICYSIAFSILMVLLATVFRSIRLYGLIGIITLVHGLSWLVVLLFFILGIVHAVKGEMKPLPLIGKITIIK
jgi:uncharacterized membrane protein